MPTRDRKEFDSENAENMGRCVGSCSKLRRGAFKLSGHICMQDNYIPKE